MGRMGWMEVKVFDFLKDDVGSLKSDMLEGQVSGISLSNSFEEEG